MRIRVLPKEITEKIAAGEVVERPASVVKELMENALDAEATHLLVSVGSEVVDRLEVVDNGTGMEPEEVTLALERHATSKISCAEDLFALETLGFRGEALSSIAAVADLQIDTRTDQRTLGVRIRVAAGDRPVPQDMGMPRGTRVVVRNLFQTIPARLKFLRSKQAEAGHILDVFTRLVLSRTEVSFQLKRAGKLWVHAPAVTDLRQRVANLFGWEFAERLLSVSGEQQDNRLEGLLGPPDLHKGTQRSLFLFVNRRPVRDVLLQRAVRDAFRGEMPKGRYPVAVLFLDIPCSDVDVNVHPTKMEVHFSRPQEVRDFILQNLSRILDRKPWIRSAWDAADREVIVPSEADRAQPREDRIPRGSPLERPPTRSTLPVPVREEPSNISVEEQKQGYEKQGPPESLFSRFRIIGQFEETYLVCAYQDHLLLVDQHAAHERIAYEKLQEAYAREGVVRQSLLIPQIVELPHREADCLQRHLEPLFHCGLEAEFYGGTSFAVKAMPALLVEADPGRLLRDIAEELVEKDRAEGLESMHNDVFARMACHAVVRAGKSMEPEEMEALLKNLDFKPGLLRCPHGRPVAIAWSLQEIQRRFQRA